MLNIKKMLKDDGGLGVIPSWIGAYASLIGCMVNIGDICGTHIIAPCIDALMIAIETVTGLGGMITECGVETLLRCFGK